MPIDSGSTRNLDRPAMKETEDVLQGFVGASGLDQDLHSSCCFAFILALCKPTGGSSYLHSMVFKSKVLVFLQ